MADQCILCILHSPFFVHKPNYFCNININHFCIHFKLHSPDYQYNLNVVVLISQSFSFTSQSIHYLETYSIQIQETGLFFPPFYPNLSAGFQQHLPVCLFESQPPTERVKEKRQEWRIDGIGKQEWESKRESLTRSLATFLALRNSDRACWVIGWVWLFMVLEANGALAGFKWNENRRSREVKHGVIRNCMWILAWLSLFMWLQWKGWSVWQVLLFLPKHIAKLLVLINVPSLFFKT